MLYDDMRECLDSFIDMQEKNELFDYHFDKNNIIDNYENELHKFNHLYSDFLIFNNKKIIIEDDDLRHIVKLYIFYNEHNKNNCLLLADFLLSYFNLINTSDYKIDVANWKKVRDDFRNIVIKPNNKIIDVIIEDSYKLYNLIIDYGLNKKNICFYGILERSCVNLKKVKEKKKNIIRKYLENNICISSVIEYDENVDENISYYEQYMLSLENENIYSKFPENILHILDSKCLLSNKIFNVFLNKMVDRVNHIQDRILNKNENYIQIIAIVDETIRVLNLYLNKLSHLDDKQKYKIHECLKNILYIKRHILADKEKLDSQMHEFKHDQTISKETIDKFVSKINENIGRLFSSSCCNFLIELESAICNYSEYPLSYIFDSYNIDSDIQVYIKSNEGIENSIFKKYYDEKGKEYIEKHLELKNVITKDYYDLLLKYLQPIFKMNQQFLLLLFDSSDNNRLLLSKLISNGNYKIKNDYAILAMNVLQIENGIVKILNNKGLNSSKNGFTNLNVLAKMYENDNIYFNGLMYINYILYERHGLNIRNNISHGNYFKMNVDVEIMTTICAIMFLNNLVMKECGDCD